MTVVAAKVAIYYDKGYHGEGWKGWRNPASRNKY